MRRRDFCKLMASAAASAAVPAIGQTNEATQPLNGFGTVTGDYAEFCATPADQRVFYALENGKFVKVKLDDKNWKPTAWGKAPELPVPGGSWDGVPMNSPISG